MKSITLETQRFGLDGTVTVERERYTVSNRSAAWFKKEMRKAKKRRKRAAQTVADVTQSRG